MSALLAQAQQMQQKLLEAQQQLANAEVHGQAGRVPQRALTGHGLAEQLDVVVGAVEDALVQRHLGGPRRGADHAGGGAP